MTVDCPGGTCSIPLNAPSFALVFLSQAALDAVGGTVEAIVDGVDQMATTFGTTYNAGGVGTATGASTHLFWFQLPAMTDPATPLRYSSSRRARDVQRPRHWRPHPRQHVQGQPGRGVDRLAPDGSGWSRRIGRWRSRRRRLFPHLLNFRPDAPRSLLCPAQPCIDPHAPLYSVTQHALHASALCPSFASSRPTHSARILIDACAIKRPSTDLR